ncbi:sarcosine oxidase subunit delta [Phreatobacter cathodiphilus]|uniref:Sarcosine oxidase subunit delta n=1 Tax=Phreatobacter cathodiphilus TaxID=1868589 RepID=A0A2S0NFM6_9HYPH|nr:sarcosine oxidase subunit delta [Phreatobacter cathodiphilus]AVO46741.1 sarcosine oxidase subunit delta [Phreatobacter cathodiphilus]
MRIPCPYCGSRDSSEFAYLGDAAPRRPVDGDAVAMAAYVYLRDNPAGPMEELWYHAQGCRSWLVVSRDTRDHAVSGARLAAVPGASA